MTECPLIECKEAGLRDGNLPCELCTLLETIRIECNKDKANTKKLIKLYSELKRTHKKCPGCGLCFDGSHIAFPVFVKGIGNVCQWCAKEIQKQGIDKFKKRLSRQELEIEEE